jgi:broad specificity phosphatase PhoE
MHISKLLLLNSCLLFITCNTKKDKVENKKNIEFYFVRHGETDWGREDILKGPQDLALNESGRKQARKAGNTLKKVLSNISSVKIVSSTLKRAIETAKEISEITGIEINVYEDGLKERYYGDYRLNTKPNEIPSDAEQIESFKERVTNTILKILLEQYQDLPLVIVSHQKVFEYVSELLTKKAERLPQGGIAHFTLNDGKWSIKILEIK